MAPDESTRVVELGNADGLVPVIPEQTRPRDSSRGEDEDDSSFVRCNQDNEDKDITHEDSDEERKTLAKRESHAVAMLRVMTFFVLLVTAILVSVAVFKFMRKTETDDFKAQYTVSADKVLDAFYSAVQRKLNSLDALSTTITMHALATNATFPNVTVPDFEVIGANARIGADGTLIYWLPFVTDETRDAWEQYAYEHQGHLMTSFVNDATLRAQQDALYGYPPPPSSRKSRELVLPTNDTFQPHIYGTTAELIPEAIGSGPFFVLWQSSPVLPVVHLMNYNVMSHIAATGSLHAVLERQEAVIDIASNLRDPSDTSDASVDVMSFILSLGQYRHTIDSYSGDPASSMAYPVFDSFGPNRTIAGSLLTNLYWSVYFRDVLPEDTRGIYVVLQNTVNQSFTYRIDGPNVSFLGPGNRCDKRYKHLAVSQSVATLVNSKAGPATRAYTQVDLDSEFCSYSLRIYPSADYEDQFLTRKPAVFTIIVAMVFAFTSFVFISYDCLVARRQRIVMERALASGAIVSSLFPANVRAQLYLENKENRQKQSMADKFINTFEEGNENGQSPEKSRPIAELFEHTTILFADLAGFTEWSAKRTPTEVFGLLESLFGAFDAIAVRRKVFKVETIGDCYVAVAGLPQPQERHAVIMARFAKDCLMAMEEMINNLAETLGNDTRNLQMRVGLHTGPTTAGVLRGQKSRFQLFGDTVNTASRMESNGEKGRIHISQATADALTAQGKSHWLVPRKDLVVAKGKGEMQTYWIEVRSDPTNTTASSAQSQSAAASSRDGGSTRGDEEGILSENV